MAQIYTHHVFFCTHLRDDGTAYCQQHGSSALRDYAKQRIKDLKLKKVRINNAGCLNRCKLGPIIVVYPEGIWYQCKTEADVDEIIQSHVQNGIIVKRLQK
ncbi:MAG: (2Fe-2S) ferredoxin domain-containing protein [Gammaproteobacteria bacterium]|nr:(2Fe-2S) ferredoxin domain-containing protein [Gammaproteobacteria bacterium]MDT8370590.1 (2Fe-2S) ferredoxin domain-containing protein [Gammaproteobacteria bacterium]